MLTSLTTRLLSTALFSLSVSILASTSCAATPKPNTVRIGVATAGGGDPVIWGGSPGGVVRDRQWLEQQFAQHDIRVEWFFFKGAGPAVNEAFSNRQIDFAYLGDLPAAVGIANGLDTKILLASGQRTNLYLATPKDSNINSINDLKNKKVSIFKGTNGHLVVNNLLKAHELKENDIRSINLDTGSAQAALISNGVDAAFGGAEYIRLRDEGLIRIPYSTHQQDPKFTRQTALVARGEFIESHPELTQIAVNEFVRAAHWASQEENRAALFTLWAKSGVPYASYEAEFAGDTLRLRNSPLLDDFFIARYVAVANDAKELRFIRRPINIQAAFEPKFLAQALATQKLENFWIAYQEDGRTPSAKVSP